MNSVKLVGMTQPTANIEAHSVAQMLAYIARVSNPKNQANHKTGPKLLYSLMRDQHWSPLEMVSLTMEIITTRDIGRQILRHRTFTFQEFSQRYAVAESPYVLREARLQDTKNRQNSVEVDDQRLKEDWNMNQKVVEQACSGAYFWALDKGIAKEQARAVLPEGMTETTMYMQGTLRSWVHYCVLRMANGTQKEHMEIAALAWDVIRTHFPDIVSAVEHLQSLERDKELKVLLWEQVAADNPEAAAAAFQKIVLDKEV